MKICSWFKNLFLSDINKENEIIKKKVKDYFELERGEETRSITVSRIANSELKKYIEIIEQKIQNNLNSIAVYQKRIESFEKCITISENNKCHDQIDLDYYNTLLIVYQNSISKYLNYIQKDLENSISYANQCFYYKEKQTTCEDKIKLLKNNLEALQDNIDFNKVSIQRLQEKIKDCEDSIEEASKHKLIFEQYKTSRYFDFTFKVTSELAKGSNFLEYTIFLDDYHDIIMLDGRLIYFVSV